MTERRRSPRRKAARKTQPLTRRSRSRGVRRTRVRHRPAARQRQVRWVRQVAGTIVFAASIVGGLLLAGPAVNFASRVDPNARSVTEIAVQGVARLDALSKHELDEMLA